jgi:hypothetical protein
MMPQGFGQARVAIKPISELQRRSGDPGLEAAVES